MVKRKTLETFIKEATEKHGSLYEYRNSKYINGKTNIEIHCKKCESVFSQIPKNHLQGKGCKKCALVSNSLKTTKSQEDFVKQATLKHGNLYDYKNSIYKHSTTKIEIHCKKCNSAFFQNPSNHLRGNGCQKCALTFKSSKKTKSIDEFIKDCMVKHDNDYDYSNSIYVNNDTKIEIQCKTCDSVFFQTPRGHLRGQGCPKCAHTSKKLKQTKSIDEFIKGCMEKHGNDYDYSKSIYVNNKAKIEIRCKKCDSVFFQSPSNHLNNLHGCPKCAIASQSLKITKSHEDFVKQATLKHDNLFDYRNSKYKNCNEKIEIHCKKCNSAFFQNPSNHLHGHGCPKCVKYKGEQQIRKVLEKLQIIFEKNKKINMGQISLELDFYASKNAFSVNANIIFLI